MVLLRKGKSNRGTTQRTLWAAPCWASAPLSTDMGRGGVW